MEKGIREAVSAAIPAGTKNLHFWRDTFLPYLENAAFVWV